MMSLIFLKTFVLDLLFPSSCVVCGREGPLWCAECMNAARRIPPSCFRCGLLRPGSDRVPSGRTCRSCRRKTTVAVFLSPLSYGHPETRTLIHALKYRRMTSLAETMARFFAGYLTEHGRQFPEDAVFIPIPIHSERMRKRGFNQSDLIGRAVAKQLDIRYAPDILSRIRRTVPQAGLNKDERRRNLAAAFSIRNADTIVGQTVFLFDDIRTTGVTMEEAARLLKKAGARRIWAMTMAH